MSKISILVPIYNVEKYLRECLSSICKQTLSDFEVICVDDGSVDESGQIADEFCRRDPRFRVIHKPNEGYGKSMNLALEQATGKYVAIIESDDVAEPEMLTTLYEIAEKTCADVVKAEYAYYFEGNRLEYRPVIPNAPYGRVFSPKTELHWMNILMREPASIWCALYKRDFLNNSHIQFHETPGASYQDVSFQFQTLLLAERYYIIDKTIYRYRADNENSSIRSVKKVNCIFDEFSFVKKIAEDSDCNDCYRAILPAKYYHYFGNYFRVDRLYQYAVLEKILMEIRMDGIEDVTDEWDEQTASFFRRVSFSPEVFFESTNIDYLERVKYAPITSNSDMIFEALRHFRDVDVSIYIYGAGTYGRRLYAKIKEKDIEIDAFVVTECCMDETYFEDIPIVEIDKVKDVGSSVFLVSMKKEKQMPVLELLKSKKAKVVYSM